MQNYQYKGTSRISGANDRNYRYLCIEKMVPEGPHDVNPGRESGVSWGMIYNHPGGVARLRTVPPLRGGGRKKVLEAPGLHPGLTLLPPLRGFLTVGLNGIA